jgi:uracil-DNA glycosylase family 4
MDKLNELREEAMNCTLCPLYRTRNTVVFGNGNPEAEIFIIGEAPGFDEDRIGKVFVGKSGQLLDKIFEACNFNREKHLYISNILKCRPPDNRNPDVEEQKACIPYLMKQIDIVNPRIIILLGSVPLKVFFGPDSKITRDRGIWKNYFSRWVMPTYHPAALLRNPNLKKESWEDFKNIIRKYRELVDPEHYCRYL